MLGAAAVLLSWLKLGAASSHVQAG